MMSSLSRFCAISCLVLAIAGLGCNPRGRPKPGVDVERPEDVVDFHTLYRQNCAGCHGENGSNGAAMPLDNPAYLAIAGETNIYTSIAKGCKGTLMPPFARSAGGMLTDPQISAISQGILREWSKPAIFAGAVLPAYASTTPGDPAKGRQAFVTACSRCHGQDGLGAKTGADGKPPQNGSLPYPIVDPTYLSLVSDQALRSLILGGRPDEGMPDWRGYITGSSARALTPGEVNDIVAWLASHRSTDSKPATTSQGTTRVSGPEKP